VRDEYHGSGAIWLDNLQCSGYEEDISQCQHDGWGVHYCGRYQHVSISCNSDSNEPGKAARLPIYIRRYRWQAIPLLRSMLPFRGLFVTDKIR